MAFANISDVATASIENRSKKLADNVLRNNAALAYFRKAGNVKLFGGGTKIYQELAFAANGNAGWYSGGEVLPTAAADVISAAEFSIAQAAVPVVINGLEQLQNSSKEAMLDLLEARIGVAESSLANLIAEGVYSAGTGAGGKQITGLDAAVEATVPASQTSTYGGISRSTWAFWRNQYTLNGGSAWTKDTIQAPMNTMWASLCRGSDSPDVVIADSTMWGLYVASLQAQQRFTSSDSANLGFPTVKFFGADVVLDGALGGFATAKTMYFLNSKYLGLKIHKDRNFTAIGPERRYATNQDASVSIIGFAGQMVCSGAQFQGRLVNA